jgi:DNA polymerase IIIc chi subunit
MLNANDENEEADKGKSVLDLTTEGPLCEKDEQAIIIERNKRLQKEALEKWARLKRDGRELNLNQ